MTTTIIYTIISLCAIGIASAVILYIVAQKFKVEEDPRIDTVESILPGANCGGCGKPGCRGFAEATVKATSLDGLFCPVGGAETMTKVAAALGMEVTVQTPQIAVVRCNGTCDHRQRTSQYDGYKSCAIEHSLYRGETDCTFGCLGCGDCVTACLFDAIHMDETGLPVVSEEKCVACGACVKACPRNLIDLIPYEQKITVKCRSTEKGKAVMAACEIGCIGCKKCEKNCPSDAIHVVDQRAEIDPAKCTGCGLCAENCPRKCIMIEK